MYNNFTDYPQDPNEYIMHSAASTYRDGSRFDNSRVGQHLYKAKKWVNGKWRYIYDSDAAKAYHKQKKAHDTAYRNSNDMSKNWFQRTGSAIKYGAQSGAYTKSRDAYRKSLVGRMETGARDAYDRFRADASMPIKNVKYKAKKKGKAIAKGIKNRVNKW